MKRFRLHLLALGVAMLAPGTFVGAAQTTAPATRPFDRELTVSPAKAEDRATERSFAFSQTTLDLRDENAAPLYLQAFAGRRETDETIDKLLEKPVAEINPEADREALSAVITPSFRIAMTEPAVRRTWADFTIPVEDQGFEALLPYLNDARYYGESMAFDARLFAVEGKHDDSADMMRRLAVFSQHIGNPRDPLLVQGLVGAGLARLFTENVAQIAELPDSPNRYWALTTLPTPMFDVVAWMQSERRMILASFPELRDPESVTAESWAQMFRSFHAFQGVEAGASQPSLEHALAGAALALAMVPSAQNFFRERGYSDEQIEQMGLYPMVARYMRDDYLERFNAFLRLLTLPYPQARQEIAALEARNEQEMGSGVGSLLARLALPSLSRAVESPYRVEREIAALRIVEAVRDYAADHNSSPPPSLGDLRLPIPMDPMTGEPFNYATEGNSFTLSAEQYDPKRPETGFTWRVHLRQTGETDAAAEDEGE